MPVLPLILVTMGGFLMFCGITDRHPVETLKKLLTDGTMPEPGTQTPKQPPRPQGNVELGPDGLPREKNSLGDVIPPSTGRDA